MRTRYSTYRTDCYGNASLAWTIEGVCVLDIYHDPCESDRGGDSLPATCPASPPPPRGAGRARRKRCGEEWRNQ